MFVQWGFNLHSRRPLSGVESSLSDTLHSATPTVSPPPSLHGRFLCIGSLPEHLQCFFIRMPKDPSPTLHRFCFHTFLAWWTSFIDTAGNTLLRSVKLPSLRAIRQSKTNLDLQSHKIWQMLSLWKWGREFVLPPLSPPTKNVSKISSRLCRIINISASH